MPCVIGATFYGNFYLLVSIFSNTSLLVKHLIKDLIFEPQLRRDITTETQLRNMFQKDITSISSKVALENYLAHARSNQKNVEMHVASRDRSSNNNLDDETIEVGSCNTEFNGKQSK